MACIAKERTGTCQHTQCAFPHITDIECVDVVEKYCENGKDCVPECKYSFTKEETEKAVASFTKFYQ